MHKKSIREFLWFPPHKASRQGWDVEWASPSAGDLNDAARRTMEEFDRVVAGLLGRNSSISVSIEGDMEPGKFPEIMNRFFLAEGWSHQTRYRLVEVRKPATASEVKLGTLVFDAACCSLRHVLSQGAGVRWMSNLRVVATVFRDLTSDKELLSPFDSKELEQIEGDVEMLLRLDGDLTHISAWVERAPSNATWSRILGDLR